jgi:hypothetical protein
LRFQYTGRHCPNGPTLDLLPAKHYCFDPNLAIGMPSELRMFYAIKERRRIKMGCGLRRESTMPMQRTARVHDVWKAARLP